MSDVTKTLVERLRTVRIGPYSDDREECGNLCREAADEIDRLRLGADIAWAAGLFEGEGAICGAQKYKSFKKPNGERVKSGYRWWLVVHSTDHDVLRRFGAIVQGGKFYGPYRDKRSAAYKPQLRWATTTLVETQRILEMLLPHLGERRSAKARECMEAAYVRQRAA